MGIFGNAFSGWHLILILAVVLLLFGAAKLPGLAKSVGESVRILRTETATKGTPSDDAARIASTDGTPSADGSSRADSGPSSQA